MSSINFQNGTIIPASWLNDVDDFVYGSGSPGNASGVKYNPAGAGAQQTTVQDKLRQYVSVSDFIPPGTDTANVNCATWVQAALDYAASIYASVFFPSGDYRIDSSITLSSATAIQGEGIDATVIRYYGTGGTAIELTGTALSSKVKINLSDFALYDHGTGVNGINMSYCYYSTLNRLRIYGFTIGISVSHCWDNEYNFIISENNTQDGFNLSTTDANALTFFNCQGVSNGRAGFYSEGGRSVLMSGCTWEANTQYGVWISGQSTYRPLSHTLEGCYIEGNGSFEVYIDSQGTSIPAGVTIRDCYFEYISGKATTAIRIVDGYNVLIDGCTFDNQGGDYSYSLYMASAGTKNTIRWGRNFDSSANGVYSEVYYENQTKMEPRAWGRFTVSGGAIASSNSFGIAGISYISAGTYEVTLKANFGANDYSVQASAENGVVSNMFLCSPSTPISNTVFRIYTGTAINTLADARTVNFAVFI
jgi:Right handed beta helix region/Pectate lyase superfamily protein